ncbi:hypothetical protein EHO60_03240 [Leptospira fletcheri]|uniref:SbsA Ig-like domain-containing protein n=2 Tax=Leptospira fletcheri TaxID=2484981 RepID=A0A4V3JDZ6_9LEPT|nr:Ig-like domain-containing protein [Leptospira fletcheri]TGK12902.1 hypothetical protein EHO60_03240 [Leptospira fletcheri]
MKIDFYKSFLFYSVSLVLFGDCQKLSNKLLKLDPFLGENEPPKVIFSNPISGQQNLPSNQTLSVGFSRAMNINSCQTAFSISPQTSGFFSNTNNLILNFSPSSALNAGTYTFTLTKACEDPNGMDIANPFSASFAVGSVSSLGTNPGVSNMFVFAGTAAACNASSASLSDFLNGNVSNACMGNPLQNQIVINFSRPMNQQATASAITISPSVSANFVWTSSSILTITPDTTLLYNQRYTISIGSQAMDQSNISLKQGVQASFLVGTNNAAPGLSSLTVLAGSQAGCQVGIGAPVNILTGTVTNACMGNPTSNTITFNFTTPMDPQSTQNAISFSPSLSGQFTWSGGNQTLTFVTDSTLGFGTRYTIAIGTSALTANLIPFPQTTTASFVAVGLNPSPAVQAIGLVSQVGSPGCAGSGTYPGTGSSTGGNWSLGYCWWDSSLSVLSPSSYQFRGGDDGQGTSTSCLDQTTDDFRIVFNNYMSSGTTIPAVSLSRISGTSTVIRLASWTWRDCQAAYPYGCRVLDLVFSELEASCGGNAAFGSSGDYNLTNANFDFTVTPVAPATAFPSITPSPNGPVYTLSVSNSATDVNGRALNSPFSFSFISQ